MADKPNLLTLPQELFDFVAAELNPEDLLNLRLVCSEANSKAFDTFKRVHFTDYSILLCDKQNLETTRAVVEHPVFGPTLRIITIFIDEVDYHYDSLPRISAGWEPVEIDAWIAKSHGENQHSRNKCMQAIAGLHEVADEHQMLREDGEQLYILTSIFSILKHYGQMRDMEIAEGVITAACRPRIRQQFQRIAHRGDGRPVFGLRTPAHRNEDSFGTVLDAILDSRLHLKSLRVTTMNWSLNAHECGDCPLGFLEEVFANLESLSIPIHLSGRDSADPFAQMLASATSGNLKSLELYLDHGVSVSRLNTGHIIPRGLLQERIPGLRELSLHAPDIVASELVDFLQAHPSLQRLRLHDAWILKPTDPCYLQDFESQGAENIMEHVLEAINRE